MKNFFIRNKLNLFFCILSIFLIIISIIYIIKDILSKQESIAESNLLNTININEITFNNIETQTSLNTEISKNILETEQIQPIETERMLKVQTLKKENSDIVGWLEIENTSINYPVLQGTDNEYYMTHNYKKEKSKNGSIFLNYKYDWDIASNNLLIYGHNLNNGTMFQELLKYSDKSFYINHPIIRFTTDEEDAEFEIISVFKSRVYYNTEQNVFRYYFFINPNSEEEYNNFVQNAKNFSMYNIDSTATYGDQLITLSTCAYHVKDGRFVVIGKKNK